MLALDDVSFDVAEREFVCIVGPSGCGKTTLLKIIARLLPPTRGSVIFEHPGELRRAIVFQEHGLFPWMNVLDNVAFGLEMQGMDVRVRRDRAHEFLATVGLDRFSRSYPHQLSVGMRQRVGIARALLVRPHLLLMDEPFAALDAQTKWVLQDQVLQVWASENKTVVFVTHDIDEALRLGDRVLIMSGRPGRIRQDISVPHPDGRSLLPHHDPQFDELRWHIWNMLEPQARASLSLPA